MRKIKRILCALCCIVFVFSVSALINTNQELIFAESVTSWQMKDGASIRLGEPNGIRFSAQVDEGEYNEYLTDTATKEVKFGMVIMPNSYLTTYGEISETTLFGLDGERLYWWNEGNKDENLVQIRLFEVDDLKTVENGKYLFNCALTNVKVENFEKDFYAKAYYSITENGVTQYYFTEDNENCVRSVSTVAEKSISLSQDKTSENYEKYSNSISLLAKYGMSVGYTLDTTSGAIVENENAIACSYFFKTEEFETVTVADGYNLAYAYYDANKNCVEDIDGATYFRFAVTKASEATNDDLSNIGLAITSKQIIRDEVVVDGKVVNRVDTGAVESTWSVENETITSSGDNTGRKVKWFGKVGSAYTVETTISGLDIIDAAAGLVISSGVETKAFIVMPFMSGNTKMVARIHVGLPAWSATWFSGMSTEFVDGEEFKIKLVNDGTTLTVYVNDVVMPTTFTANDYPNLIGSNNAIGLIVLNDQVSFSNTTLTFEAQKEINGTVSVASGIDKEYDLTKTVVYAHTTDKIVRYDEVVDANGNFNIIVPNDTQALEFKNSAFISEIIDISNSVSVVFDNPILLNDTVVLNGETITSANVANGGNETVWEYGENTASTQGVGREVKWFKNTGNAFTVETEILGHTTNDTAAGIVIATANKTYAITIKPANNNTAATRYVYDKLPSDPSTFPLNGPLDVSTIGYYKIKLVSDGSNITVYMGSANNIDEEITSMTTITTLNQSSETIISRMTDIIGKEVAIGLVTLGGIKVDFRNFSVETDNVTLTQYTTVNGKNVGGSIVGGVDSTWTIGENSAQSAGTVDQNREVRWLKGTGTTYTVETEILGLSLHENHAGLAFTNGTNTFGITFMINGDNIGRILLTDAPTSTTDTWLRMVNGPITKSSIGYYKIKVVYDGTTLTIKMGSGEDVNQTILEENMVTVETYSTGNVDMMPNISNVLGVETAIGLFVRNHSKTTSSVTFRNYSVTFGI